MDDAAYYAGKARQCRRLARATVDQRTLEGLVALAKEFDAKAKAAQGSDRSSELPRSGAAGE